jgi:hypothetical protein
MSDVLLDLFEGQKVSIVCLEEAQLKKSYELFPKLVAFEAAPSPLRVAGILAAAVGVL